MSEALRIVKVGGSLFDLPDLPQRLHKWLQTQTGGINVLLAGCGAMGNCVRELDARFQLREHISHGMCVDLLAATTRLLAGLLPATSVLEDWERLAKRTLPLGASSVVIFNPVRFLHQEEAKLAGEPLPTGWDVTTDSIAARLAEVTRADDLVLLKSSLPRDFSRLDELSDAEYVDRYFPWAVRPLAEVRFVNLRDDHFPVVFAFE